MMMMMMEMVVHPAAWYGGAVPALLLGTQRINRVC